MDLYREQILDHYRRPRHWGLTEGASTQATGHNPLCGDAVTVQVDIEGEHVQAMRFVGHGCAVCLASASLVSEYVPQQSVASVAALGLFEIQALLGTQLPPARIKCGLLALETAQTAVTSWQQQSHVNH